MSWHGSVALTRCGAASKFLFKHELLRARLELRKGVVNPICFG